MSYTTTPLVGSTFRARREALSLSRVDVAVRTGFSPAHIAQLEAGYRPRRGDAVVVLDRALSEFEAANENGQPAKLPVPTTLGTGPARHEGYSE